MRKSGDVCLDCYCLGLADRISKKIAPSFSQDWVRDLFNEFHEEIRKAQMGREYYLSLRRYGKFFEVLDRGLASRFDLNNKAVFDLLGGIGLRKAEVPHRFLIRNGYLPAFPEEERKLLHENRLVSEIIREAEGLWYQHELVNFRDFLSRARALFLDAGNPRLVPGTIGKVIRVVKEFLEESATAGVHGMFGLNSAHFAKFMRQKRHHYHALRLFATYLDGLIA